MKRLLSLILAFALALSLAACGKKNETETKSTDSTEKVETTETHSLEVDENLLTVDVTIPAILLQDQDMTTFDPDAYAKEQGFKKAVVNEDGSLTVTMSKAKHREMMQAASESLEDSYAEIVGSETQPCVKEIKHSGNYDSIDILVDRSGFEDSGLIGAFLPMQVYLPAAFYMALNGDKPHCRIQIVDADSGDTLASVTYPDDIGN